MPNTSKNSKAAIAARARDDKFFISQPCKHGHVLKYASTGTCVDCQKRHSKKWNQANPDKFYQIQLKYIKKKLAFDPENTFYKQMHILATRKLSNVQEND